MVDDSRLVEECRNAAREAARVELALAAEVRGLQSAQITDTRSALARIEQKLEAYSAGRQSDSAEVQELRSRVNNLGKMADNWELFQTNYRDLEGKLDRLTAGVESLQKARDQEAEDRKKLQEEHEREAKTEKRRRTEHRWALFIACSSSLLTLVVTLLLHFLGAK